MHFGTLFRTGTKQQKVSHLHDYTSGASFDSLSWGLQVSVGLICDSEMYRTWINHMQPNEVSSTNDFNDTLVSAEIFIK